MAAVWSTAPICKQSNRQFGTICPTIRLSCPATRPAIQIHQPIPQSIKMAANYFKFDSNVYPQRGNIFEFVAINQSADGGHGRLVRQWTRAGTASASGG